MDRAERLSTDEYPAFFEWMLEQPPYVAAIARWRAECAAVKAAAAPAKASEKPKRDRE